MVGGLRGERRRGELRCGELRRGEGDNDTDISGGCPVLVCALT